MSAIGPRLVDLGATFVRHRVHEGREAHVPCEGFTGAQGIRFRCPRCADHEVYVWFDGRGVAEAATPHATIRGTSLADLSLTPSIDFGPACWRGTITNGWVSSSSR